MHEQPTPHHTQPRGFLHIHHMLVPSSPEGIPDGGYAWVIAAAGLLLTTATWGANSLFGVFLAYYIRLDYFGERKSRDFAFVGGMNTCLGFASAPFVYLIKERFGVRAALGLGMFLQTCGYILASFATRFWQLFLTQGLLVGTSLALVYVTCVLVLPNWFYRHRALASGIVAAGSGLGGLVFSLSANKLLKDTGNQHWPLRMVGIVTAVVGIVCTGLMKEYPSTHPDRHRTTARVPFLTTVKSIFSPTIVFNVPVLCVTVWFMCLNVGYFILKYLLALYAIAVGLTPTQGSNLTAILNAGQVVGRPFLGTVLDRVGRVNATIFFSILEGILFLAYWSEAQLYGALIGLSLLCGLFGGIHNVNCLPLAFDVAGPSRFALAYSFTNVCTGVLTLFSEVIGLALRDPTHHKPYYRSQMFAGSLYIGGGVVMGVVRFQEWRRLKHELAETNEVTEVTETLESK